MRNAQRGGAFGTTIIIALLAVGGYYAYTELFAPSAPPSCKERNSECLKKCRRTATEAPTMRACQESCERDAAACK